MSGHKEATVTISEEEYRRLHEADMKVRFMQEDYPEIVRDASRMTQQHLRSDFEAFKVRQQQLLDTLGGISDGLVDLETQTQQSLFNYQAQIQDEVQQVAGTLWEQSGQLAQHLYERHRQVQVQLERQAQENFRQFATVLRQQAASEQARQALAHDWIEAGIALAAFIHANYPHDQFQPGRLGQMENRLVLARQNLEQGLSEAAISMAQESYQQLGELRLALESALSEYRLLQQTCREQIKALGRMVQRSARIPAVNLAGQEMEVRLDVDYWTQGGIKAMLQELRWLGHTVDQGLEAYSMPELRHLCEQVLPEKEKAICDLAGYARVAALSSQLRLNIADIVVRALFGQGYALEDASYTETERDGFFARVIDRSGSEIVIQVDPEGPATPENRLHLIASDRQPRTQHELRQRSREIERSLQDTGLLVSSLVAVDDRVGRAPRPPANRQQPRTVERPTTQTRKPVQVRGPRR